MMTNLVIYTPTVAQFVIYSDFLVVGGLQCGPPPGPLNAKLVLGASDQIGDDPNQFYGATMTVTFICDPGFELIG